MWVKLYNAFMDDCLLCSFNDKKQCIEETSGWYVDIPRDFTFEGLYFLRCKRHIESLAEMNKEESREIGSLIQKYSKKSQIVSKAQRVLAMSLGLSDPHIHFWILPKAAENESEVLQLREATRNIMSRYKEKIQQ